VLFFAPLFLIEVMTLSLLTLSPMVRLSRTTFFWFALMLAVFAVWGLFGFAYPSAPVPFALNVLSKILAFVTALSLFLPQRAGVRAPDLATSPSTTVTLTPSSPAGEAAALSSSASWSATRTAAGSGRCSI
jgi:hypothetical protein